MAAGLIDSEKERAAEEVLNAKAEFEMALSDRRKYALSEFRLFVRAARRYIGLTAGDPLIHRKVAGEISGLSDYLESERRRVLSQISPKFIESGEVPRHHRTRHNPASGDLSRIGRYNDITAAWPIWSLPGVVKHAAGNCHG
jgi:hypothetical protein